MHDYDYYVTEYYSEDGNLVLIKNDDRNQWADTKWELNESFTKYQTALISFLATENGENLDYLPTSEEVLERLPPSNQTPTTLGPKPKKSQQSPSHTIINYLVVPILKSDNPPEVSKSLFQRLLEMLSQFSADSDTQPPTLPPLL
jgi:hypothetical protein